MPLSEASGGQRSRQSLSAAAQPEKPRLEAAIMKRIINGFEIDWASERVFAERQAAPNYGYSFEVSADRKRVMCVHISAIGGDSDNSMGRAERFEEDARQAVEEFPRPSSGGVDRERLATFYECARTTEKVST